MPQNKIPRAGAHTHEVVRFPESKRERRRILRSSEDPRLRLSSILASACGWLFALALILFIITNYRLFLPESLRRLYSILAAGVQTTTSDAATIDYASGSIIDATLFGSSLAYVDSDTLYVSKPNDLNQLTLQISYGNPVVEATNSLVLAYDRGGNEAVIANAITALREIELDSPILSGTLGDSGAFALVTDESGFKTAVRVFNSGGGDPVFIWQTSRYYIQDAALSPDGSYLALLAFQQDGIEMQTDLLFWRLRRSADEQEPDAVYSLGSSLGYAVEFLNSSAAAVVTDHGAHLVTKKGVLLGQKELSPNDMIGYAFCDRGILLASNAYQGAAHAMIELIATNGTVSEEPLYINSEIQQLSADGATLGVLTTDGLKVYSVPSWHEQWHNSTVTGARSLRMDSSGTAYVLYGNECRIFRD